MMMRNALKMQGVQRLAMLVALVVLIVLANIVMMQHVLSRAVSHLQSNMLKAMEARIADINSERAAAAADVRRIMTGKEIVTSRSLYLGDHTVNCYNDDVGMWFLLDSRDVGITPHLCHGSGWEPMITQVFRDTVQTGWHVIDAGANFGWYSAWLARLVGESGKVVSVEANPRTHELLSHTIELAGLRQHVTTVHTALYKEDGLTVSISMNPERSLNNNIRLEKAQKTSGSANVQTSTLDTIMKGTGWTKVDFIKIDVEGVEDFVWEGMQWIVENNPDVIIFMEVNANRMADQQRDPRTFFKNLQATFPVLRYIDDRQGVSLISIDEMLSRKDGEDIFLYLKKGAVSKHL